MVCDTVLWLLSSLHSVWVPPSLPVWQKKWVACQPKGTWKPITSLLGVSPAREMAHCRPAVQCTMCPRTLCHSIGTKHDSGWRGHVDWSHCSLPLTSIAREHWHTNRKEWRAESTQKCQDVVGRKTGLLSIALCGLLASLSSQASVLMERLLWKDTVVAPTLGGIHR